MDPELLELLNRLQGNGEPLSDAELGTLRASIHAIRADIDTSNPTPDDIATLTEVRDNLLAIKAEEDARTAEREARAAEAAAIVADIPALPEPVAEVEPEVETPDGADVVAEAEQVVEDAPEPVAASSTPPAAPRLPSISHLAQRRPQRTAPVARPTVNEETSTARYGSVLTAASNLHGIPTGAEIDGQTVTLRRWADAAGRLVGNVLKSSANNPDRDGEQVYLATKRTQYPAARYLSESDTSEQINAKLEAVTSPTAITAAGGICGPVDVDYSVQNISVADRPVTTAMAQFGASRGGLRFILPHTLAQVNADGGTGVWTAATDANPGGATKAHATYVCQPVQEVYVDAITSSVQFSNFQTMFFPEQVAQYMATLEAQHARLAESTMLQEMISSSSWIANEQFTSLGTARDILAAVDRAAAAIRYRNRTGPDTPLRLVYPEWLEDNIRTDLARQLPGDSGSTIERLATADAEIARWFAVRNINVTKALDSPTSEPTFQGFVIQGNGALLPWPSSATMLLYPEGSFVWLNGGELNLGMIRSATLALTNQVLFFSESFERAVFKGVEAGVIRCSICPSGATSGTVDIHTSICTSGS